MITGMQKSVYLPDMSDWESSLTDWKSDLSDIQGVIWPIEDNQRITKQTDKQAWVD